MATTKFTDIDFLLTKNELTNDISVKYDANAISQSIKNIILTTQGEKLFSRNFGGNAYSLVFNSPSRTDIESKRLSFAAAVASYEPRADVQTIDIRDSGEGNWIISVEYRTIYDQNTTKVVVIPLQ